MLKLDKYTNPKLSVVAVSASILRMLMNERALKYDELLRRVVNQHGASSKETFLPSLNFLFLLNKVKYFQEHDMVEYI